MAEKYDYKKIILISPMFTAAACIVLAVFPSFMMALFAWVVLVFSTLFMIWGSLFKAIRLLGTDNQQGKINGFYSAAMGIGYLIINIVGVGIYDKYAKTNPAQGMRYVFICFGIIIVIFSLLSYWCLRTTEIFGEEEKPEEVNIFKTFGLVAKDRGVWYFGGTMFFLYSANISMQYFTPYFSDVLGVAVVFGGIVAIIRQYGLRCVGSPVGGMIADKIGSLAKVLIFGFGGSAAVIATILLLPGNLKTVGVLTILMLTLALFNNVGMGTQYALISEAKVPRKYTAGAIGMGTMLGYSPDVYQHVLFGSWLDKWGERGYTYIFIYGLVASILGAVLLINMLNYKQSESFLNKTA